MSDTIPRPADKTKRARRYRGPGYDWRDHPDCGYVPECDMCAHRARWAIAQPEDFPNDGLTHVGDFNWTVRQMACGQHLHAILDAANWHLDAVQVYDLAAIPEGGC